MKINKYINKQEVKDNIELPLSGNLFEKNRKRISIFKLSRLVFVFSSCTFIIFIILYGIVNSSRTKAESITQDTILSQLSRAINLPDEGLISVLRVSDAKNLANQNNLYKNVKNGDYIIAYKSMILVYDFDSRFIKNVKTIDQ